MNPEHPHFEPLYLQGSYAPAISEITEKFLAALDADCKSKGETNFSDTWPPSLALARVYVGVSISGGSRVRYVCAYARAYVRL